jgi:hypothetical protein
MFRKALTFWIFIMPRDTTLASTFNWLNLEGRWLVEAGASHPSQPENSCVLSNLLDRFPYLCGLRKVLLTSSRETFRSGKAVMNLCLESLNRPL